MLSEEIWIQILSYLNQKELCTLSEVDSKFCRLARDPAFWRKNCGSNLPTATSDLKIIIKMLEGNLQIFFQT
jgi:hypothetical protein